jgi:long-chain fatty acid transport protein
MKRLSWVLLAALPASAHAGGLSRPNGMSARGTGMGGAFTAWADDASAVFFNPAAMDDIDPQVDIGAELVVGPRSYTPVADDGTKGPTQKTTIAAPVPALGVVGRFYNDDQPSRITLGAGLFNTFGGTLSWKQSGQPAFDSTEDVVIEAIGGASLHVSDRLAVGASVRLGLGLFGLDATQDPFDAHLSASGVGAAAALGAVFTPTENVRIGLAWRSPLRITTEGSGTVTFATTPQGQNVSHEQVWPQEASLGIGWRATPAVRLAVQADWAQWSQLKQISVTFPANHSLDQVFREDWKDTWAVRAGGEYAWSGFAVRGGAYVDTNAVPDRSIERQYLDQTKIGVAAGATAHVAGWRVDAALDCVLPGTREVPNNNAATAAFPADRNKAPGEYKGTLVTIELAVARPF